MGIPYFPLIALPIGFGYFMHLWNVYAVRRHEPVWVVLEILDFALSSYYWRWWVGWGGSFIFTRCVV